MQKLAVALTTQEEIENLQKLYRYNSSPLIKATLNRCRIGVDMETGFPEELDYYKKKGYKIISLKEAIGEKENKEIIREGEARGFEPKTKKQYRNTLLEVSTEVCKEAPRYISNKVIRNNIE